MLEVASPVKRVALSGDQNPQSAHAQRCDGDATVGGIRLVQVLDDASDGHRWTVLGVELAAQAERDGGACTRLRADPIGLRIAHPSEHGVGHLSLDKTR